MFLRRSTRYVDVGLTALILLVAASTPLWLSGQYLLYLGGIWLMYALLSYGLAYLYAQSGQLSIAHAALWGVGAYTSALLLQHFGWGFWTSLAFAALAAAFTAAMIGLPALRLSSHYFVIATFAVAQFLVLAAENLTQHNQRSYRIDGPPSARADRTDSVRKQRILLLFDPSLCRHRDPCLLHVGEVGVWAKV